MATVTTGVNDEARVRELVDDWAKAVRAKDITGIMSHYAPDILAFDAIAQLQFKGAEAYKKHWEACLSYCQGATMFEVRDLNITVRDDIAFSHFLNWCGGTTENGEEQGALMRATVCYRKINGRWLIVHEHFSAPFDMESGKALFDLEP